MWRRWGVNLGLYALGLALLWACIEGLEQAAVRIGSQFAGGGLATAPMPDWLKIALGVLLVDAIQYALHRLAHWIPLLWRAHQVHHADVDLDVTSAVRHHPLETLAMTALSLLLCVALGLPLLSLLLYSLVALPLALFCHANIAIPAPVDRWLRWCIVTPDMHRLHHSVLMDEGNSNFGMAFPWWDRLFGTYRAHPMQPHATMPLGLSLSSKRQKTGWWRSLWLPFEA